MWITARCLVLASAILLSSAELAHAEGNPDEFASALSGPGTSLFLAAGVALPLLREGDAGEDQALRSADTLIAAVLASEGLKAVVASERPDGSGERSFPSSHASAAFSIAALQAEWHPDEALLWYGGAALIGASRVKNDRHRWTEVLAGAVLGYGMAQLELGQKNGLILQPLISGDGQGLAFLAQW